VNTADLTAAIGWLFFIKKKEERMFGIGLVGMPGSLSLSMICPGVCRIYLVGMLFLLVLAGCSLSPTLVWGQATPPIRPAPALLVHGNRIVTASGQVVYLHGANRSTFSPFCQGDSHYDRAGFLAMRAWDINVVRLTLNQHFWLDSNHSCPGYRDAVRRAVAVAISVGLNVILDLHWNDCADACPSGQQPMADRQSIAFWRSVATTFRDNDAVLFDLYNEPHGISWNCWRNGGCVVAADTDPGVSYPVAGMQQLLDAVRGAGAHQVVLAAGPGWASDVTGWQAYLLHDPDHNLAVSFHVYNFSYCNSLDCWNSTLAPLAQSYPVVATELGEYDCSSRFIRSFMDWADQHGIGYLGWTWETDSQCPGASRMIVSWDGRPTPMGLGFYQHYLHVANLSY